MHTCALRRFDIWATAMNFILNRNPRRARLAALTLTFAACLLGSAAHAQTPAAPPAVVPVVAPAAVVAPPAAVGPAAPAPALPAAPAPAPGAVVVAPPARRPEDEPGATPGAVVQPGTQRTPLGARIAALFTGAGPAQLHAQIMTLTTERDTLRQQLTAITAERDTLRNELNGVEQALNAQQNVVRATATEIATTVGIPQSVLPAPVPQEAAKGSIDDLKQQLKTEQDSRKRAEISQQIIKLERKAAEAPANA